MKNNVIKDALMFAIGAALLITMLGCTPKVTENAAPVPQASIEGLKEITVQGCQYLVIENGIPGGNNYSLAFTHKGNCSNEVHRTQRP